MRLRTASYLHKWLVLGALIGVVAGLGAVLFSAALTLATHLFLVRLGGFTPATPTGEGGVHPASMFARPWAIPLVVALGGLLSGVLVFAFAPEAAGHGTDAAIKAVHTNPKGVRHRVVLVKLVASAITIGSGGSAGREGPTAQISAGFGSLMSRWLNLTPEDSRIAVTAGIASGIGAIFRAPLGGALLGAELLYTDDVEVQALIPSLVASVVSFAVFGGITGHLEPIFGYDAALTLGSVGQLLLFAVLGLLAGGMGRLYAATFYGTEGWFSARRAPRWLRPAAAGVFVGLLGLVVPGVLGTGYGQVQQEMSRHVLLGLPLWIVLAIPFAKILATSLTIGSGGSGGIFGPGMVIGASTGAALWRLLDLAGLAPHEPGAFVIVGMAACFGAIAHAPLAVMLMVAEMTGNLALLPPTMIAVVLASVVVRSKTIYRSQLATRDDSPAHRFTAGFSASATIVLRDVMVVPQLVLDAGTPTRQALEDLDRRGLDAAPVVNREGSYIGVARARVLQHQRPTTPVSRFVAMDTMAVPVDAGLGAAIDALATSPDGWVPVLDVDQRLRGVIAGADVLAGWRTAMRNAIGRIGAVAPDTEAVEVSVAAGAPADGQTVGQLPLPAGTVVVAVHRGDATLLGDPHTTLQPGDTLSAFTRPADRDGLARLVEAPPPDDRPVEATGPAAGDPSSNDPAIPAVPATGPTPEQER